MTDRYLSILHRYWGYDSFRGIQRQIVESIGARRDTLGLMPTGGGKSITFQVPAMAMAGTCIVVSPLIALMEDQVAALRRRGIRAAAIHSGMARAEIVRQLDNVVLGEYRFLYVSPERLQTDLFQSKLRHMRVSFITVDEAHCISQWGYDFRPSYLQIAALRSVVPQAPILALTATATPQVVEDIQRQLHFRESNVLRMSFERKNLAYVVRNTGDKLSEMVHILQSVPGCAIVYTRNRQQTQDIADFLNKKGISATYYHALVATHEKMLRQQAWQEDKVRVMVATNAFGMGIDKADVRLVVHAEMPDSPEAYFQEAGRAGRDGGRAWAVVLVNPRDCTKLTRRIDETYPPKDYVYEVYDHLCYYLQMAVGDGLGVTREFDLQEFCYRFKHFPVVVANALELLSNAGYIEYRRQEEITSRLRFVVRRDELYRLTHLSRQQDLLINLLLRSYPGLFADYVYIDEALLADEGGLEKHVIYTSLVSLDKMGIVSFIPHKRTDLITFTQRRVAHDELRLPAAVWDDRRRQYSHRIEAMTEYVTTETCRSRFLLNYFGETDARDCGLCDVCQRRAPQESEEERIRDDLRQQLMAGPLPAESINTRGIQRERYVDVLTRMVREGEVRVNAEMEMELVNS